ncbi:MULTISPECIES: hypothetical protein [unclassified Tolypothrix]|uniref:hypothetical protein n=1 Tax=unclassified Tolypothrix TaxID=2649714 RepID=UPI00143A2919|nr:MULTISPECIES: hypothetical protein [unclassified Tolypothrix]UYD31558.1 hypothetical protein HG267_20765 [Tolypothrix sp. PCC 7601]
MGTGDWGIGMREMGEMRVMRVMRRNYYQYPMPNAPCPMPNDGSCYNGGDLRNALPPPCPMPHSQFSMPNAHYPIIPYDPTSVRCLYLASTSAAVQIS